MFNRIISNSIVLPVLGLLAACSSPPIEGERYPTPGPAKTPSISNGNQTTAGQPSGSPTSPSAPPAPSTPPPTTPPDPTATCGGSATFEACVQCCAPNPDVFTAADQAFETCACAAGACKTQCGATFCAQKEPDAACDTCLKGQTACQTQADGVCNADTACKAALDCMGASKCDDKP
jgi:hypothetical protein